MLPQKSPGLRFFQEFCVELRNSSDLSQMLSKKPERSVTFGISTLKEQMFRIIRKFCVEILTSTEEFEIPRKNAK